MLQKNKKDKLINENVISFFLRLMNSDLNTQKQITFQTVFMFLLIFLFSFFFSLRIEHQIVLVITMTYNESTHRQP